MDKRCLIERHLETARIVTTAQTDNIQANRQKKTTNQPTNSHSDRLSDQQTDGLTDLQTYRPTDQRTDRPTD